MPDCSAGVQNTMALVIAVVLAVRNDTNITILLVLGYAPEMPDALSLREDKSFDGAREASRCSSRSRYGWTTTVSSMKRDTMSAAGGSALSADRSAPNIGLFVFIRVPDVLTVIRVERSVWTRRSLHYLGLPRIPLVNRLAVALCEVIFDHPAMCVTLIPTQKNLEYGKTIRKHQLQSWQAI
ncbi:hypothetical protein DBV15_07380 [Temnothorax longispinosus]|uniref:Uncharacterized protein n=1 Tax=Temnothorax longispinosus TaxID=300112 RepID=A0A4S2KZ08_9HYME|nr:hypothetical protein DBV15_07380 [Temnothorax longispinosus]